MLCIRAFYLHFFSFSLDDDVSNPTLTWKSSEDVKISAFPPPVSIIGCIFINGVFGGERDKGRKDR